MILLAMVLEIGFRHGTQDDLEFLFYLKKKTLKEYVIQVWGWDEDFQYTRHVENVNPEAYTIIQAFSKDVGCYEVEIHSDKLFLSVIEILPTYQNQGIGSTIIRDLLKQGEQENKNIELQVLKVNQKAFHLYLTLGFTIKNETETHYQMVYQVTKV